MILGNERNVTLNKYYFKFEVKSHNSYIYIYIYIYMYIYHHYHVVPLAWLSLTLSRHFSLSFIASGRSSGLHLVSSHSCCMYVRAGRPAFAWPNTGVHEFILEIFKKRISSYVWLYSGSPPETEHCRTNNGSSIVVFIFYVVNITHRHTHRHAHTHTHTHTQTHIYIYIYIERERERERDVYIKIINHTHVYIYIYIYIYRERERESGEQCK